MTENSDDATRDPIACALSGQARDYEWELGELRRVLDEVPVAGFPRRDAELAELRRLIARYPEESRHILRDADDGAGAGAGTGTEAETRE